MIETSARVPTRHAANMRQASASTGLTGSTCGAVENAVATLTRDGNEWVVILLGNDRFTPERLQEVIRTHLDRFAFGEAPLPFSWSEPSLQSLAL